MFVLIERDPFIRTDMCLTLGDAFPEVDIVSVATVAEAEAEPKDITRPRLVLIDSPPADVVGRSQVDAWQGNKTPMLWTNASGPESSGPDSGGADSSGAAKGLARPFTAEMLIAAVEAAMRTMA